MICRVECTTAAASSIRGKFLDPATLLYPRIRRNPDVTSSSAQAQLLYRSVCVWHVTSSGAGAGADSWLPSQTNGADTFIFRRMQYTAGLLRAHTVRPLARSLVSRCSVLLAAYYRPYSTWLDTSRLDTARHVRRVERVVTSVSSRAV